MAPPEKLAPPDHGSLVAEASDASLISVFRRGGQDAATQLYFRYAHRLRALVRKQSSTELAQRTEADDIVQSVFRVFFSGAREGLYRIPRGDDLWQLLLVIALNKVRRMGVYHHAEMRDVRRTTPLVETARDELKPGHEDEGDRMFLNLAIREALEKLPADYRQLVEMRIEGYEIGEIAAKVGRAKRSVERILQEARKLLATHLQDHD